MEAAVGREFGWNEEIKNDGNDFTLLNEGEYPFEIQKFERGRSRGSDKMPPCNMAILTIRVDDQTTLTERLVLHSKMEWKLCQFFTSIGLRKHGEKIRMDWSKVTGAKGRCKVVVEDYIDKNGATKYTNRIDKFLDPAESGGDTGASNQHKKWTPGKF